MVLPDIHKRRGSIAIELMVAAGLLVCLIGVLAPVSVRTSRMWRDSHQVRLAVDELSNQLELLTDLNSEQRTAALEDLAPSEDVRMALPHAVLTAETIQDEDGSRLVLSIDWDRRGNSMPLTLVGWINAEPVGNAESENESVSQKASLP